MMEQVLLLLVILLWWVLSSATACIQGNAPSANPNLDGSSKHVIVSEALLFAQGE